MFNMSVGYPIHSDFKYPYCSFPLNTPLTRWPASSGFDESSDLETSTSQQCPAASPHSSDGRAALRINPAQRCLIDKLSVNGPPTWADDWAVRSRSTSFTIASSGRQFSRIVHCGTSIGLSRFLSMCCSKYLISSRFLWEISRSVPQWHCAVCSLYDAGLRWHFNQQIPTNWVRLHKRGWY